MFALSLAGLVRGGFAAVLLGFVPPIVSIVLLWTVADRAYGIRDPPRAWPFRQPCAYAIMDAMPNSLVRGHAGRLGHRGSRVALAGLVVATLSGLALAAAGLGYRSGWWPLATAFSLFRWGAYGGAAGAAVALAGAFMGLSNRRTLATGALGVVIGTLGFGVPWRWQQTARAVPRIHDITTDLENPPAFVAILPLRANAPNTAVYGGPTVAAAQRSGYPDLAPAMLNLPAEQAFTYAEQAARSMGWEIVSIDRANGLIEATDTTRWFGFKDDVVIRVRAAPGGSRVDVRSLSRVGGSDVGTNAKRIREYLRRLMQESEPRQ